MPRRGENIYKRKDGRWEGRFIKCRSEEGKIIYGYVYAYSYKDVRSKLKIAMAGSNETVIAERNNLNFKELSEQWLYSQRAKVKESTYNKYSNILYSYVFPYIGNKSPKDFTMACFSSLCDTLLRSGGKEGKGLSMKTVGDTVSVVKSIIKYSKNAGYSFPVDLSSFSVKTTPRELHILSETDQKILYSYLCSNTSVYNVGILICLLTGIRIGEVCALCWEDISFADRTIHINKTVQRIQDNALNESRTKIVLTSPKSVTGKRTIPMPENLEKILSDIKTAETGFVISKDSVYLTEPRVLQYRFKKILGELGIEQVNFHVLRHTFATRCIEVGFDVKSLSEILGHSTVSITMNKYVHPSMKLKRENMKRFSSLFAVK